MARKPRPKIEPPRELRLLTRADAARLCGVTTVELREMVRDGEMPPPVMTPAGDRWRLGELDLWVAARGGAGTPGVPARRPRRYTECDPPRQQDPPPWPT